MKNSILYIGIALVSITTVCNASNKQYNEIKNSLNTILITSEEKEVIKKPSVNEDSETFNPETVIRYQSKTMESIIIENDKITENKALEDKEFLVYEEAMKEVIAQSDLIIENTISNEEYPLYIERSIEDEIAELDLIIENTIPAKIRPLNFKKISKNTIINVFNPKTFVGMN